MLLTTLIIMEHQPRMKHIKHLKDLTPDPQNARRHTPRGLSTIERSLHRDGFGRSLLLASDGTIIAGNATAEAAGSAGIEKVRVIDSDGTEVIAIRRTDIASGTSEFANLAVADNRASEHSAFDPDVLNALADANMIDPDEFWFPEEFERLSADESDYEGGGSDDYEDADTTAPSEYFAIVIETHSEREQSQLLDRFAAEGLKCRALIS